MSSRYDAAPRRRPQQPEVSDPDATGIFTVGNQGEGLQAVSPEDLARARAMTAEAKTLRPDSGADVHSEKPVVRLGDMSPADRIAELDRRIADFMLLDDVFSGARQPEDLSRADKARAREALQSLTSYQNDVADLRGKSERVAISEIVRALNQWRDETYEDYAKQNEPAPQPRLEQFTMVQPKGYEGTNWYVLSIEDGVYVVANRDVVMRDKRISARDIATNIRRGNKDRLGIVYQNSEPLGFVMSWQELEQRTNNGA